MTATCLTPAYPAFSERSNSRGWAMRLWQGLIFCAIFSIIFLPEYGRSGESSSPVYAKLIGGFRVIDIAILLVALCHLVCLACLRHRRLRLPRSLLVPGVAFMGSIAVSIGYGSLRGGSNFFFDWRGLALGIALYLIWSFWFQRPSDVRFAMVLFAVTAAVRIAVLYALYFAGRGDTLAGVSIPLFDGPVISAVVFTALLAFRSQEDAGSRAKRLAWYVLAFAAYALVLLCLRRTYWGELAVGSAVLLLFAKRRRVPKMALIVAAVSLAAAVLGSNFFSRIQSLDMARADTAFSADNADHVNDIADAWEQVRQSPVLGVGVGMAFPTWRIRGWKPESVMVHNAPLHVWLKYGILGLISYLWFHLALLWWLYRRATLPGREGAFVGAAFAYLLAHFVMTLTFAPWPYSELQMAALISFLVAGAVAVGRKAPRQVTL